MTLQLVEVPVRPAVDTPPQGKPNPVLVRLWGAAAQAVAATRPPSPAARQPGPAGSADRVRYATD
jgi:hypothetical protein